jgi:hypothetical protein
VAVAVVALAVAVAVAEPLQHQAVLVVLVALVALEQYLFTTKKTI